MFLRFNATLNGASFADIADEVVLVDVTELPAAKEIETASMAGRHGERVSVNRRTSLTVRLTYVIRTQNIVRRAQLQRLVSKWAMGFNGHGELAVNYRPGQVLSVRCDNLNTIDSALMWAEELQLEFVAHETPYWVLESAQMTEIELRENGDSYSSLFAYVEVPGDFDGSPVDAYVSNYSEKTLTKLMIKVGESMIDLQGFECNPFDSVEINNGGGVCKIRLTGLDESILHARTAESSDELTGAAGRNSVFVQADAPVTVMLSCRGWWL